MTTAIELLEAAAYTANDSGLVNTAEKIREAIRLISQPDSAPIQLPATIVVGVPLLDFFAGQALTGLLAREPTGGRYPPREAAQIATDYAVEMLAESKRLKSQ